MLVGFKISVRRRSARQAHRRASTGLQPDPFSNIQHSSGAMGARMSIDHFMDDHHVFLNGTKCPGPKPSSPSVVFALTST